MDAADNLVEGVDILALVGDGEGDALVLAVGVEGGCRRLPPPSLTRERMPMPPAKPPAPAVTPVKALTLLLLMAPPAEVRNMKSAWLSVMSSRPSGMLVSSMMPL